MAPIIGETLDGVDFERLAALHLACLPTSAPARFGPRYIRTLYRYIAKSGDERLFVARVDGVIVAACVASLRPATLMRRLLLRTPVLAFMPQAVAGCLMSPRQRARGAHGTLPPHQPARAQPEVVWLYAEPGHRRRGLGRDLVGQTERFLSARGLTECIVVAPPHDSGLVEFYARCGFRAVGVTRRSGHDAIVLSKAVTARK